MVNKVRVYGKAQNRTALGIMHAYMVMYPQATMEDLQKAFPNELNPDSGVKKNFVKAGEKGTDANWDGFFQKEKDADYKNRMVEKYKGNPCVSKDNKFDFGKAVVMLCLNDKNKPFAGTHNETYMNELLVHWREFHEKKLAKK